MAIRYYKIDGKSYRTVSGAPVNFQLPAGRKRPTKEQYEIAIFTGVLVPVNKKMSEGSRSSLTAVKKQPRRKCQVWATQAGTRGLWSEAMRNAGGDPKLASETYRTYIAPVTSVAPTTMDANYKYNPLRSRAKRGRKSYNVGPGGISVPLPEYAPGSSGI